MGYYLWIHHSPAVQRSLLSSSSAAKSVRERAAGRLIECVTVLGRSLENGFLCHQSLVTIVCIYNLLLRGAG